MRHDLSIVTILLFSVVLAGCSSSGSSTPLPTKDIQVSPDSVSMTPGDTRRLRVTVSGVTDTSVNFESNDDQIAVVNSEGLISAVAQGNTKIITTSTVDTSLSANATVTVIASVPTSQEAVKLADADGGVSEHFGESVAADGDRIAVAAPSNTTTGVNAGMVFIYERAEDGSWPLITKLTASSESFRFGSSLSLNGDRLLIGANNDSVRGSRAGAAFIFERDEEGRWVQIAKLFASDAEVASFFGSSVSLSGDYAVVGAMMHDSKNLNAGAAYVYERQPNGTWLQLQKLIGSDVGVGDRFGESVAIDGSFAVISALGQGVGGAYIYERQASGAWVEVDKLIPGDGVAGAGFGNSSAISGSVIAIGADDDDDKGDESGSVYLYERQMGGSWAQIQKLVASDGTSGESFGTSLALNENKLVVGAEAFFEYLGATGTAYLFENQANGDWLEVQKFVASDRASDDRLGASVALSDNSVVVGAPEDDDNGEESGTAYIFVMP